MKAFAKDEFQKYNGEAEENWGNTDAYKEYKETTKDYSSNKWNDLSKEMDCIMAEFASCLKSGKEPNSTDAQSIVKTLQNHITENYYPCTNEILAGLGKMYVLDERFKNNIDKHAEGTAEFICQAINIYCGK